MGFDFCLGFCFVCVCVCQGAGVFLYWKKHGGVKKKLGVGYATCTFSVSFIFCVGLVRDKCLNYDI